MRIKMVLFGILPYLVCVSTIFSKTEADLAEYGMDYDAMNGFFKPKEINFNKDIIKQWAINLSRNLTEATNQLTAFNEVYAKFNLYYMNKTLDVKDILKKTSKNIFNLLQDRVQAVMDLVKTAEDANMNHTFQKGLQIDYLNNKKLLSDDDLDAMKVNLSDPSVYEKYRYLPTRDHPGFNNVRVNVNVSTVHVPTNVFDKAPVIMNGVAWSEKLNKQFLRNEKIHKGLTWQYFCSSDGFFRVYPGMKWPRNNKVGNIDMFDCRVRPWYIKGSASPKNVIILVDTSGSMKGLRMEITRSTIVHILDTFSEDDYFNIIQFSNKAMYTDPCFNRTMMQANKENRERMTSYIKNMQTKNIARFDIALQEAFDLFEEEEKWLSARISKGSSSKCFNNRSSSHLCNKIIMILTDGAPEGYEKIFKQRNWDFKTNSKKVRVFTFLIGREVSDNRNAKWMACANKGYYTHISTLADVQENVQHYLKVLSRPLVINKAQNQIWTQLYADYNTAVSPSLSNGLKFVTSFGMPVYDRRNLKKGKLLGVMGTDVPIEQIKGYLPMSKLGPNGYAFVVTEHDYVLFHPNLRPFHLKETDGSKELNLKANYSNMNIENVEYIRPKDAKRLRRFIRECDPSKILTVRNLVVPYAKKKRVAVRSMTYYIHRIGNTTFKLVFALPTKYGSIHYWIGGANLVLTDHRNIFMDVKTKFAPWRYCNSDDTLLLDGPERRQLLSKLFYPNNNNKSKQCDEEDFKLDLKVLYYSNIMGNQDVVELWKQAAQNPDGGIIPFPFKEFYDSQGIELIFLWTRSGITRYYEPTGDLTDPGFIDRNLRTVENPFFKRSVEGKLESGYNYTFSIPIVDGPLNPNKTVVTITIPVPIRETNIPLVMGLQMRYTKFKEFIENIVTDCGGIQPCDFTCQNASVDCYLLDNHGYIMASITNRTDENWQPVNEMGMFFGDVEPVLMQELVNKNVYKMEHFVDYQAMCEVLDGGEDDSAATNLLDPFRKFYSGLLWFFTEIILFLTEWSFSGWWESLGAAGAYPCTSAVPPEYYDEADMDLVEREILRSMKCVSKFVLIPCHKNITLYRANISRFKIKNRPIDGSIVNCVQQVCNKTWVVSWINNTNLIFVATSAECVCMDSSEYEPVNINDGGKQNTAGTRIQYTQHEFCKRLKLRSRCNRQKEPPNTCVDSANNEDDSECGQGNLTVSVILLLLCSLMSIILNRTPSSYL